MTVPKKTAPSLLPLHRRPRVNWSSMHQAARGCDINVMSPWCWIVDMADIPGTADVRRTALRNPATYNLRRAATCFAGMARLGLGYFITCHRVFRHVGVGDVLCGSRFLCRGIGWVLHCCLAGRPFPARSALDLRRLPYD